MRVLLTALLAACGTSSQSQSAAVPANHTAPQPDPRSRADQALREEEQLDYGRPFDDKPVDRSRSMALYREACRGGDKAACWLAMTVANPDQLQAMVLLVEANCTAGDAMSCRALPVHNGRSLQFPSAPGGVGRSEVCERVEGSSCDLAALRRECAEGFAASCAELAMSRPTLADADTLLARAVELAGSGCRDGIVPECRILNTWGTDEQKAFSAQRICELDRKYCEGVGIRALKAGDQAKARDAFERGCQLTTAPEIDCAMLGVSYLDHKLVEPVPGRGQSLVDWGCNRMLKRMDKEKLEEVVPECTRATLK